MAQVRERLAENGHNVSVTNAGIRGYATDQAYFRMKEVLDSIDGITHVVYLLSLNDPLENTTLHFPGRVFGKRASYLDPEGNVGFLSAEFQTGIWDRAYKFVGPGAAYGEVPVIETETTGLRQLLGSRLTQFEGSYLLTLIKITAEQYLGPASPQHKDIQSRYPYLKIEYRGRSDGALEPSVDVRWEEDAYPMMLAARLIELMAREVGRRGKKFQLALPLTMSKEYIAVIKKLLPDHVAIADPSDGDLALEAYRECGGTVTFEYDGHYSPCGHLGQAESIAGALTESLTGQ
ncbi:MAG: hypothetical protein ACR2RB_09175 [Gammaproteobacteria bacterium]